MEQIWKWIRYSLDPEGSDEPDVKEMDWQGLYRFSCEQAIAGVVFDGVKRLGEKGVKPPFGLLMDWLALAQRIEGLNKLVNRRCVELTERLRKDGFESCILKGQGNTLMYPNPYTRTSGDIDVWICPVLPNEKKGRNIQQIIRYVKAHHPEGKVVYHHSDYGTFGGVEVEVHHRPSFMFNPFYNRRLQCWFEEEKKRQFSHAVELPDGLGKVVIPTLSFNCIYQLVHILNHEFYEGVGLRQLMDYYLLLRARKGEGEDLKKTLRHLGLYHFAGAVMYVMREVFHMPEEYHIVPVDVRRGQLLMRDILKGGNFGKCDEANIKANSQLKKNWQRIKRDIHLMREYPSEALCEPIFRTWHFFWRLRQL